MGGGRMLYSACDTHAADEVQAKWYPNLKTPVHIPGQILGIAMCHE